MQRRPEQGEQRDERGGETEAGARGANGRKLEPVYQRAEGALLAGGRDQRAHQRELGAARGWGREQAIDAGRSHGAKLYGNRRI